MKSPDIGAWHRTSPFAILFFFGKIIRLITKNAWQSFAPLFAFLIAYKGDLVSKLILGGSVAAVALIVGAVLSWLFFRYQICDDSILIRSGVIKKKQLDIKFDRIQGVNTQQNPVYRVLGLVTITFDTAGSAGDEGNLPAVTREFANELRKNIGGRKTAKADDEGPAEATEPLLKLDWRDMIRIGLADRRALIIVAFIGPLIEQVGNMEQVGDNLEKSIENALLSANLDVSQLDVGAGTLIVVGIFFAAVFLLVAVSIAAAFLQYHNFELFLDGRTLRSHGGLITRHEHSMDLEKIQTIRLQQGVVQNWLGRFRMTLRQAISGRKQRSQKVFTIPVVTAELADNLRPLLLASEAGRLTQDPRADRVPGDFAVLHALTHLVCWARTRRHADSLAGPGSRHRGPGRISLASAGWPGFVAQLEASWLPARRQRNCPSLGTAGISNSRLAVSQSSTCHDFTVALPTTQKARQPARVYGVGKRPHSLHRTCNSDAAARLHFVQG